ncbi:unnamed protein product [Larinioides sclopetarius]|uniref:Uncharacterized protein n=1 Tax=Larinioides sclopetarius TaxID=280406 RepID=A0AAV2BNH4_9ARAC
MCIIELMQIKNLILVIYAIKCLLTKVIYMCIIELTQMKNHILAMCVKRSFLKKII